MLDHRGPMKETSARITGTVCRNAAKSGNPPAYIAAVLDIVRDVYEDCPAFVTQVVDDMTTWAEVKGLLGSDVSEMT